MPDSEMLHSAMPSLSRWTQLIAFALPIALSVSSRVEAQDCNRNGTPDSVDIAEGNSPDCNQNEIPDECDVVAGPRLSSPQRLGVDAGPVSVAIADFDADGRPDLVSGNQIGGSITVYLNQEEGRFTKPRNYPAGSNPTFVLADDFDGDGAPDIAVANVDVAQVSVLVNRDGKFNAGRRQLSTGEAPVWLASDDVNGDGNTDLIVANFFSSSVTVFSGIGNGTFEPGVSFPAGRNPTSVGLTDLDGDGRADIIATSRDTDSIEVLLNRGQNQFSSGITISTLEGPQSLLLADLESDGDTDVVTVHPTLNAVGVLINTGDALRAPVPASTGVEPLAAAAVDLDRDGLLELVTADRTGGTITVLQALEGSSEYRRINDIAAGQQPIAIASTDFFGDEGEDVAVAAGESNALFFFVNLSTNAVSADTDLDGVPDECQAPTRFVRGDCNNDGEAGGSVTDAVFLLNLNFLNGADAACLSACDANGDGDVFGSTTDAVYLLNFSFLNGPPPPAPFPDCGSTPQALCDSPPPACETPP